MPRPEHQRELQNYATALLRAQAAAEPCATVTVVETQGSTPRKAGTKMLILEGRTVGTIGGGAVEHEITAIARKALATRQSLSTHTLHLTQSLAMCCGGSMTLMVEPHLPAPRLVLFGLGHVGTAVARVASIAGFELQLVDEHIDPALWEGVPCLESTEAADLDGLELGDQDLVFIATRSHELDQRLLEYCAPKSLRYLGVIGSHRKARMQEERLRAKEIDPAVVHCPAGPDIGAQTPGEIAVAVVSEMIAVLHGKEASA